MADAPETPLADRPLLPPVKWLFAPDLIAYGKQVVLHAFYGGDLDPRDWMRIEDGHGHVEDAGADAGVERDLRTAAIAPPASGELWFDYLADIGDGGAAMYTTALACGADLTVDGVDLAAHPAAALGRPVTLTPAGAPSALPRGQFLFVGGDTAYHVADVDTLAARVQVPFARAARDLAALQPGHATRRLYGIPGNHDYYAQLIGFNRMFRHGATRDHEPGPGGRRPLLALPGYARAQEASYLAIALPWGWQLLGLDIDAWMDARQEWYFRALPPSERRIVCTPSPPIVQGAVVPPAAHVDALARLGLPPLYQAGTAAPPPGTCRLDLSGDTHHYARYQPHDAPPAAPAAIGLGERAAGPVAPTAYASVVSGGGGAFHHPSFGPPGTVPERALYPQAAASRRAVSRRLMQPWSIFDGGLAWIMPLVLTLTGAIGATGSPGTRWLGDHLLTALGLTRERDLGGAAHPLAGAEPDRLVPSLAFIGFGVAALVLAYLALRVHGVSFTPRQRRSPMVVTRWLGPTGARPRRFATLVLVAAAALAPFASPWLIEAPLVDDLWFDAWWLVAGVSTLAAGVVIGAVGGRLLARRGQLGMIALGTAHGVAHLITPFAIARIALSVWWLAPVMVALLAVALAVGRVLVERGAPWWVLVSLWLGPWLAGLAIAVVGADGVALAPVGAAQWLVVLAVTAAASIAIGCAHMGWYLTVSAALGAHGNEVGGAARVDEFRQFIRFRLTERELTAFVIAIDRPATTPDAVRPYVVDVFQVGTV